VTLAKRHIEAGDAFQWCSRSATTDRRPAAPSRSTARCAR
jgi:hypothetical protein